MSTVHSVIADSISRTYYVGEPVHALDGVSLELPAGSFTAVMGPSGSGKSTLLNMLGCLDTIDEGTLTIHGRDVGDMTERERAMFRSTELGFVFQAFYLMPRLRAWENVSLPLLFSEAPTDGRRARAERMLDRVGVGDRIDHLPNELSGGQRQRVAIARALVNEPRLLLADEPTGNLDTKTGASIMELFTELHDEGTSVVLVTHERYIAEYAEQVVHMVDGQITEIEPLGEVGR